MFYYFNNKNIKHTDWKNINKKDILSFMFSMVIFINERDNVVTFYTILFVPF